MKTKKEVLRMSRKELQNYKWSVDLHKDTSNLNCFDCSNCLYCRNLKCATKGYWICNIEVTKKEFEIKKKELGLE